jgi:transcription-repair coupling factor (superfamily II helicase)
VEGLSEKEAQTVQQQAFIDDAVIDIEMLAELPDSYVRQPAEKIKLYRELDSLSREEDLLAFEGRLVDRFGALPEAAKELLNVVRLRWEAVRLGMERVKVKNGLMIVQFVGDDNSPYYKSEVFMTLLKKITAQPDRFVLKQRNNRLAMTVRRVADIAEAVSVLKNL